MEKERAEHIENCEEFGRVLGMNVQDWWMGLRGQIDDRLLEKIKRTDMKIEGTGARQQDNKKPKTHKGYALRS